MSGLILDEVSFVEHEGAFNEWRLDSLRLKPINLIVGQNATGKSRTLNVIVAAAQLISSNRMFPVGHWTLLFSREGSSQLRYTIKLDNSKVTFEKLTEGETTLLDRLSDGTGSIFSTDLQRDLKFGVGDDQVVTATKRDSVQHPFLEQLHEWADGVLHYRFGEAMGKTNFGLVGIAIPPDPRQQDHVAGLLAAGKDQFGQDFITGIVEDMVAIGYDLEDVQVRAIDGITMTHASASKLAGVCVKESQLAGWTEQHTISQGMFRALSILIHINYLSRKENLPALLLVDDIGEGLDFERSTKLINILVKRAQAQNVQIVLTTNDRFVMNAVDLAHWRLLVREGQKCRVLDKTSSPDLFSEFEYTGLSNFDFLATQYWKES